MKLGDESTEGRGDKTTGREAKKATGTVAGKKIDRTWLLRGGVIAAAVVVALIAWLATRGDDGESSPASPESASRIVSEAELSEAAAALGQPIYWVGPVTGTELELEELGEGAGARVRYVPEGSEAGEAPPGVLTVGSYPLSDPAESLQGYAGRPGAIVRHSKSGLEVVSSEERPTSVYFAAPDNSVQVEVYDPSATKAMGLALSGKVKPAE